jgi:hypothetical protein
MPPRPTFSDLLRPGGPRRFAELGYRFQPIRIEDDAVIPTKSESS